MLELRISSSIRSSKGKLDVYQSSESVWIYKKEAGAGGGEGRGGEKI